MAAAQGLAWPLPPGSLAVAGVSLQQTSVKPSEVLAGASGVFWLQKRPPFSAAMMVIFTDLFLLFPPSPHFVPQMILLVHWLLTTW